MTLRTWHGIMLWFRARGSEVFTHHKWWKWHNSVSHELVLNPPSMKYQKKHHYYVISFLFKILLWCKAPFMLSLKVVIALIQTTFARLLMLMFLCRHTWRLTTLQNIVDHSRCHGAFFSHWVIKCPIMNPFIDVYFSHHFYFKLKYSSPLVAHFILKPSNWN